MSVSLSITPPVRVSPEMMVGTDVPEDDYPQWDPGDTYADGERVILVDEHKVYESLAGSNTGNDPLTTLGTSWIEVGPTNRWKAFDLSHSTQTRQADSMYFEIAPGAAVTTVALLNTSGLSTLRIRMTDPDFGLLYDETFLITSTPMTSSWYEWFFGERVELTQRVVTGLPSYPNAVLRLDLSGASTLAVGVIMIGQERQTGASVLAGVGAGIQDYSRKEADEYGEIELIERAFAKRASLQLMIPNEHVDGLYELLVSVRAQPCLFAFGSLRILTIFGFYKEFEILISYVNHSDASLDIEGLT